MFAHCCGALRSPRTPIRRASGPCLLKCPCLPCCRRRHSFRVTRTPGISSEGRAATVPGRGLRLLHALVLHPVHCRDSSVLSHAALPPPTPTHESRDCLSLRSLPRARRKDAKQRVPWCAAGLIALAGLMTSSLWVCRTLEMSGEGRATRCHRGLRPLHLVVRRLPWSVRSRDPLAPGVPRGGPVSQHGSGSRRLSSRQRCTSGVPRRPCRSPCPCERHQGQ
jgi:hypothetical protein